MSLLNDALKQAQRNTPPPAVAELPASPPPTAPPPPKTEPAPEMPGDQKSTHSWTPPPGWTPPPSRTPPPAPGAPKSGNDWFVMGLAFAAVFLVSTILLFTWLRARHNARMIQNEVTAVEIPTNVEPPKPVVTAPPSDVMDLADYPALQGIFYSPTAPMAILDGKTVRVGERSGQYRVTQITKNGVTLVGDDGKPVKLSMAN